MGTSRPRFARPRAISKIISPLDLPSSGARSSSWPTAECCSLAHWVPPCLPTVFPPHTVWQWRWPPPFTDSSASFSLSASLVSTSIRGVRSSPPSPSGGPVLCPFTCTSILPGLMLYPLSSWPSFCGIGTKLGRSTLQWLLLGACTGLMLDVYYPNAMVLVVLLIEAIVQYRAAFRGVSGAPRPTRLLANHLLFVLVALLCFLPTFIAHRIIYGDALESGYIPLRDWLWRAPALLAVLFSPNHGLLSWTPILLLSIIGLAIFWRRVPAAGGYFAAAALAFYLFIACYPDWAGISSYGNRFFVSLTMLFVLGLAIFLDSLLRLFSSRRVSLLVAGALLAALVLWNAGLMFQWGSHLVPARGPISFSEMIHNQFFVVPRQLTGKLETYLFRRRKLMQQIEDSDIQQMKQQSQP